MTTRKLCEHIYYEQGADICPKCGRDTHRTDWALQNKLAKEWKEANPDAKYGGWWSI